MSVYNTDCPASANYYAGKNGVLQSFETMSRAMQIMVDEHVKFHESFADVQKRVENMKKTSRGEELNGKIVRETALGGHLSNGNLPDITAFRRPDLEKAFKKSSEEEKKLEDLQKKTGELLNTLFGGRPGSHK